MNLNNFYKRYYYENGIMISNTISSVEFSKDVLWTIEKNPIPKNSRTIDQIKFTIKISNKLPTDFLKNL